MSQESKLTENWTFDLIDCLRGPIITFSISWADTIPQRLFDSISIARLASQIQKEETATFLEIVIYLYTACLCKPLSNDWTDIYTHCTCKVAEQYWNENHWETIKAPRELNAWQKDMMNNLGLFIYQKRRKILKERLKSEPKYCSKIDEAQPQQLTLFA